MPLPNAKVMFKHLADSLLGPITKDTNGEAILPLCSVLMVI